MNVFNIYILLNLFLFGYFLFVKQKKLDSKIVDNKMMKPKVKQGEPLSELIS
jgi:hypothetical protein